MKFTFSLSALTVAILTALTLTNVVYGAAKTEYGYETLGAWGSANYTNLRIHGNYAFCAGAGSGLDIIDISSPTTPRLAGQFHISENIRDIAIHDRCVYMVMETPGLVALDISTISSPALIRRYNTFSNYYSTLTVYENLLYVADRWNGLDILDLTNPGDIREVASFKDRPARGMVISRQKVFACEPGRLAIYSLTNPRNPVLEAAYAVEGESAGISLSGHRLALMTLRPDPNSSGEEYLSSFYFFDIANPSRPVKLSLWHASEYIPRFILSGHLLCAASPYKRLSVFDVSRPDKIRILNSLEDHIPVMDIQLRDGLIYVANDYYGLRIVSAVNPSHLKPLADFDQSGNIRGLALEGQRAYLTGDKMGVQILDISDPRNPAPIGGYYANYFGDIRVKNGFIYLISEDSQIITLDARLPKSTFFVSKVADPNMAGFTSLELYGNYLMAVGFEKVVFFDLSHHPGVPALTATYPSQTWIYSIYTAGNRLFLNTLTGFEAVNITDPRNPVRIGMHTERGPKIIAGAASGGESIYWLKGNNELTFYSTSHFPQLVQTGRYRNLGSFMYWLTSYDDRLYCAENDNRFFVWDYSLPNALVSQGSGQITDGMGVRVVLAQPRKSGDLLVFPSRGRVHIVREKPILQSQPKLTTDKARIRVAIAENTLTIEPQVILVANSGAGDLKWSVRADENAARFTKITPSSGVNSGKIVVTGQIKREGLLGSEGYLFIEAPGAINSPLKIPVELELRFEKNNPIGKFEFPANDARVSGEVVFSGWALDDTGIDRVVIYREQGHELVRVANAVRVEGARPDLELLHQLYPERAKAGWGYTLPTFLPPFSDGVFTFHVIAYDHFGHEKNLGTRRITIANSEEKKPFGTFDAPGQGMILSGSRNMNTGWVLAPPGAVIPRSGATLKAWVDGIYVGKVNYSSRRKDIETLFPEYENSDAAGGRFSLDVQNLVNGFHTINWTATDDMGNTGIIGSRYFAVQNPLTPDLKKTGDAQSAQEPQNTALLDAEWLNASPDNSPALFKTGYTDSPALPLSANADGEITVFLQTPGRLEIDLLLSGDPKTWRAGLLVNGTLRPLPIGATLDRKNGRFCWQPGPGFVGDYSFVFVSKPTAPGAQKTKKTIRARLMPRC